MWSGRQTGVKVHCLQISEISQWPGAHKCLSLEKCTDCSSTKAPIQPLAATLRRYKNTHLSGQKLLPLCCSNPGTDWCVFAERRYPSSLRFVEVAKVPLCTFRHRSGYYKTRDGERITRFSQQKKPHPTKKKLVKALIMTSLLQCCFQDKVMDEMRLYSPD